MTLPPDPKLDATILAMMRAVEALRDFLGPQDDRPTRALIAMIETWCLRQCETHARRSTASDTETDTIDAAGLYLAHLSQRSEFP